MPTICFFHCINMYVNMLLAMELIIVALKISWPPTSLQRLNLFFTQILLLDLFVSFFLRLFFRFWGVLFSSVFLCVSVFFSISLNIYCPSIHHHRHRHHHLHNDNVGDGKISQQREFYTNIK